MAANTSTTTPRRRRVVTAQTQVLRQLADNWNTLTGTQKSTWQALAGQIAGGLENGMPTRAGAYAVFVGLNSTMLAAGMPVTTTAPAAPTVPAALPPVLLAGSFSTTDGLSLTLSSAAYAHKVLVYAARPLLVGQDIYRTSPFKLLGVLPALGPGVNLAPLYAAKYRVPSAGYQIAFKFVPVTDTGFRAMPLLVSVPITAKGVSDEQGREEETGLRVA